MAKRLIGQVSFSIEGSYLVEHSRDIVLRGEWNQAINFLRESLEGFTIEHALLVLSGEMTLTGNSNIGINMEKDEHSADYIREAKEVYLMDLFYENGTLYKFDRKVSSSEFYALMDSHEYKFDSSFTPEVQLNLVKRHFSDVQKEKVFRINAVEYIIAVKVDHNCYPMWYKRSDFNRSHQEFYRKYCGIDDTVVSITPVVEKKEEEIKAAQKKTSKFINKLINKRNEDYITGSATNLGYKSIEDMSADLKKQVMKACEERNVTWEKVIVSDSQDNQVELKVPLEIVIGYLSKDHSVWNPVCESGLKMYNDSPWHSDLWLAMGNSLSSDAYDMDNENTQMFYDAINEYRFKNINNLGDFVFLNDTKLKHFQGRIVFEDSENITDKDILVLPNAGLKYVNLARKAGMVITETGGQMAHLGIVGKEEMFTVIVMKDAIRKMKSQYSVKIDFEKKTINGSYM